MYIFVVIIPWGWHLVCKTCRSLCMPRVLYHEVSLLDNILTNYFRGFFVEKRLGNNDPTCGVESSWNAMAHRDAGERKWRRNWRMEWVTSTLHTSSEHGVSSITTADAHNSAASSRPNWRPHRFKWPRPFRRKTKSGFHSCAITFQTQSTPVTIITFCSHEHSVYVLSFQQTMFSRLCHISVLPVRLG